MNKSILFLGLCLCMHFSGGAQDLREVLCGGDSRIWELRDINFTGDTDWESEEFGDLDEFDKESELAQLIPETIIFYEDGTCEMVYVSYYPDSDDSPSDNFDDDDLTVHGTWRLTSYGVEVTEADGWKWSLNNITVRPDEDGSNILCQFAYDGDAGDIESIVFDWEEN